MADFKKELKFELPLIKRIKFHMLEVLLSKKGPFGQQNLLIKGGPFFAKDYWGRTKFYCQKANAIYHKSKWKSSSSGIQRELILNYSIESNPSYLWILHKWMSIWTPDTLPFSRVLCSIALLYNTECYVIQHSPTCEGYFPIGCLKLQKILNPVCTFFFSQIRHCERWTGSINDKIEQL